MQSATVLNVRKIYAELFGKELHIVDSFGKTWDSSKTVLRHGVSVFTAVSDERKMRQRKKGGRQSSRETLFLLRAQWDVARAKTLASESLTQVSDSFKSHNAPSSWCMPFVPYRSIRPQCTSSCTCVYLVTRATFLTWTFFPFVFLYFTSLHITIPIFDKLNEIRKRNSLL